MAITGHFDADFAKFQTAVDNAIVKLRGFETGAGKVESQLNKMADQFSGRRVISEATLMAEAVERIGGASNLTAAELARVSAKAAEASEKMKAMGMTVPAGIAKLAGEYKGLDSAVASAGASMGQWVASMVSAQAITNLMTTAMHALVGAVKDFGDMVLTGAGVGDVEENFQRMTEAANLAADTLMGKLRDATHNTVTDFELMKTVNSDLAAGMKLTEDQFALLGQGAFALAQATGGDVKQAFDAMNEALLTGQARGIKALVGTLDLTKAEKDFAEARGLSADKLTEEGKLYVAREAIFKAVGAATERLGEQTDGLDEKVAQAQTSWKNFTDQLGKTIANSPVLAAGLDTLKTAIAEAFGETPQNAIRSFTTLVDDTAIAFIDWAKIGVQAAGFVGKEFIAVGKVIGNTLQIMQGNLLAFKLAAEGVATAGAKAGVPGAEAERQRLNTEVTNILVAMEERGKLLKQLDALQDDIGTGADKVNVGLDKMKASMIAARTESERFVGPLKSQAEAHDAAAAGAGRQAAALENLFDTARSGKEIMADALDAIERQTKTTEQQAGPKTGLDPRTQLAALQQLLAAEEEYAASVRSQLTLIEDRKKFDEEWAKRKLELLDQIKAKELEVAGVVNSQIQKEFEARARLMAARGLTVEGQVKTEKTPGEQYQEDAAGIMKEVSDAGLDASFAMQRLQEASDKFVLASGGYIQTWGTTINGATAATQNFGATMQGMVGTTQRLGAAMESTLQYISGGPGRPGEPTVGLIGRGPAANPIQFVGGTEGATVGLFGRSPQAPFAGATNLNANVNVFLDGRPVANALSKVIMDDNTRKLPNY